MTPSVAVSEQELLASFEDLSLATQVFKHGNHVRLAWYLLQSCDLPEAVDRFVTGLRRFAVHNGVPELYNETITLFYLFEIRRRLTAAPDGEQWQDFRERNQDLLLPHQEFLARFYSQSVLGSEVAKHHFLPPDLG